MSGHGGYIHTYLHTLSIWCLIHHKLTYLQTGKCCLESCVPNCAQNAYLTCVCESGTKRIGDTLCHTVATNKPGCGGKFRVEETQAQVMSDVWQNYFLLNKYLHRYIHQDGSHKIFIRSSAKLMFYGPIMQEVNSNLP